MGDITAMESIDRFIEKHGEQIRQEYFDSLPAVVRALCPTIVLGNDVIRVNAWAEFPGPDGGSEDLALAPIDIADAIYRDEEEWEADCEMGY